MALPPPLPLPSIWHPWSVLPWSLSGCPCLCLNGALFVMLLYLFLSFIISFPLFPLFFFPFHFSPLFGPPKFSDRGGGARGPQSSPRIRPCPGYATGVITIFAHRSLFMQFCLVSWIDFIFGVNKNVIQWTLWICSINCSLSFSSLPCRLARRETLLNEVKWQLNGSQQLSTTIAQHWNYAKQRNQALLDVRTFLFLKVLLILYPTTTPHLFYVYLYFLFGNSFSFVFCLLLFCLFVCPTNVLFICAVTKINLLLPPGVTK